MIENIIWFPLLVYNMHFLGYIYMCTDTLYFMWTIYKTGHYNIQYYIIYLAENDLWMRLKNILYHICFDNREILPGDDDDDDVDDDDDDDDDNGTGICQHEICNLQMMKLLKYSENK